MNGTDGRSLFFDIVVRAFVYSKSDWVDVDIEAGVVVAVVVIDLSI